MSCKHLRMETNHNGFMYRCARDLKQNEREKLGDFLRERFNDNSIPGRCSHRLLDRWHLCPFYETGTAEP